jgi:hypothetical protein
MVKITKQQLEAMQKERHAYESYALTHHGPDDEGLGLNEVIEILRVATEVANRKLLKRPEPNNK